MIAIYQHNRITHFIILKTLI